MTKFLSALFGANPRRIFDGMVFLILIGCGAFAHAAPVPTLALTAPIEGFVGESFCTEANFTNTDEPGFSPYFQIVTTADFDLMSADFVGISITPTLVGTFPTTPSQLTDPLSQQPVDGTAGGKLYVASYPIGSVVVGQPVLTMDLCFDVASAAPIDILQNAAFSLVPAFGLGDTATGANGPIVGSRDDRDFTPRVIIYELSDATNEMENPPGPAFTFDLTVTADIASDQTVTPIDFSSIMPIVLPSNVQFVGPITFSDPSCSAVAPPAPPPESPGGTITLSCPSGTGTIGEDDDIVITIPVYIVDSLDETTCSTESAINTAKHVTISKASSGGAVPGGTVTYSIDFQVSEYVAGITSLQITDVIPDGLTFVNTPMLAFGGNTAIAASVTPNSPGIGQTTVVYNVTALTGVLPAAAVGTITYDVTIDQFYDASPFAGQPLRTRDRLTNTVVGDYDLQGGASACQDDSAATIEIPGVASSKTLISPAGGVLQPGDTAVWRLQLKIPSGDSQQVEFNDFFPLPVIDVTTVSTVVPIASNPHIAFGPTHTASVGEPLLIEHIEAENRLRIVWPDISSTVEQIIEVDVSTVISSEPFANGLVLSNILEAKTNNSGVDNAVGLTAANITLQEPELDISKTARAPTTGLEAGDSITYDIVVTNSGDAEAYDVVVTDTPDAVLTGCTVSSVSKVGMGDLFGVGFELSGDLAVGDTLSFVATCELDSSVENRTTYTNTASVVWAALANATPFPAEEDSADVETATIQAFKDLIETSEGHTADSSGGNPIFPRVVATGEIIRYRAWGTVPQGVTPEVELRDLLPLGLEYVAGQTFVGLVSDSGTALSASALVCASGTASRTGDATDVTNFGLDCALEPFSGGVGSGSDPRFDFGDVVNTEDDSNEELVIIEFNVRVVGDVAVGTEIENRMRAITGNGFRTSARVAAVQQSPTLLIQKNVTPTSADADDSIEYVVVIEHAPGSVITAFDIAINDVIPVGLTYDATAGITGPQVAAAPGTDTCSIAGLTVDDSNPDTSGLLISFDQLAVGDVCEIRYSATTDSGVLPNQTITNTATLTSSSLPVAGTTVNPTGSLPGAEGDYSVADNADLSIEAVELTKSIVSTSVTETTDVHADSAVDPRPLTLGEEIRYRLQMRLPEGDAPAFVITDNLANGLQYVANSAAVVFVTDGGGTISSTPALSCASGTLLQSGDESSIASITPNCALEPSGGAFASGTDPVWNLGDLMNTDMDVDAEFVVIEFSAILLDAPENINGTSLPNTFDLSVDGAVTSSAAVVAEVEVPSFGLAKRVSAGPSNNADGTYSLEYTLVLENPGPYAISAIQVQDDLAATFGAVSFNVTNVVATNLTAAFPGYDGSAGAANLLSGSDSLAGGATGTITISLTLTPGNNFGSFDNSATATSLLPSGVSVSDVSHDGTDPDGDSDGFANDDSDPTPVTLAEDPEIGLAKRVSAGPVNNEDGTYSLTYTFVVENSGDVNLVNAQITDNLAATFSAATFSVENLTSADVGVNFPGFDGSASQNLLAAATTLIPGETAEVVLELTLTPGNNLGSFDNSATATGLAPSGATPTDMSDDGSVPDGNGNDDPTDDSDVTSITLAEAPEIGVAKRLSTAPVNNEDGTYSLSYTFVVENSGDVNLANVQITDDLATTFGGAAITIDSLTSSDATVNLPGFDGSANQNLLAAGNALAPAETAEIILAITVTPGNNFGTFDNVANAAGLAPSGATPTDQSDDGSDPDGNGNGDPSDDSDVTPVTLAEAPEIGLAKRLSSVPVNNEDGTYSLSYTFVVENSGDVNLANVQITDDLATTFGGAAVSVDSLTSTDVTVNFPGFDGSASKNLIATGNSLTPGESAEVVLAVTITPGNNFGPFNNSATATGLAPSGATPTDQSDDGTDPDGNANGSAGDDSDPTPVLLSEDPEIGLAKRVSAGPLNNQNGTYSLTYSFVVENSGDVNLANVQITENLATTFSGATFTVDNLTSSSVAVNFPGFDGSVTQNMLAANVTFIPAQTAEVLLSLTVTPGANLGPYDNMAAASGLAPSGATPTDLSDNGVTPDGNGNGDPGDDSAVTPVLFAQMPELGLAKTISSAPNNNADGTYTLTYSLRVENSGDIEIRNLQVNDALDTAFAGAAGFTVDAVTSTDFALNVPGYDGLAGGTPGLLSGTETLAAGASGEILLTVTVTPGAGLGPYNNTATVEGSLPTGGAISDVSDNGTVADGDGDSDPSNDSDPTPVTFAQMPQLGLAKIVSNGPINNQDGTFTVTYRLFAENTGDVQLTALQIVDNLDTTFSGASGYVVDSVSSSDFTVDFPGYVGTAPANLLTGADTLAAGASGTVDVTVTITPAANLGPYNNFATTAGTPPTGTPITDTSHAGNSPDGNGNGDPADDSSPTPVAFVEGLEIGLAKQITAGPTNNSDGTYSLTYQLRVENTGDIVLNNVQVNDGLDVVFAAASSYVIDSVSSSGLTPNINYDGSNNLLSGTDSLASSAFETIDIVLTVTPGNTLGPYVNSATAQGASPAGVVASDTSDNGAQVDENGNDNPTDDSDPTTITFAEEAQLGIAKQITSGPINNADGTHTLTYRLLIENTGLIVLSNVQIVDDLDTVFTGVDGYVLDALVSSSLSTNPNYAVAGDFNLLSGADSLQPGASATADITLTVSPGSVLGPYSNVAVFSALSPSGLALTDDSDDGAVVDGDGNGDPSDDSDPTLVTFTEDPQLGIAKQLSAGPVNNGDGSHTLTYRLLIENTGQIVLNSVQVVDDLDSVFAGVEGYVLDSLVSPTLTVNPTFALAADFNLLSGADVLQPGAVATADLTVTVTPGSTLGPYSNVAVLSALSPSGVPVTDDSHDGAVVDGDGNGDPTNDSAPTLVTFVEDPQLGVAKELLAGPTNNGDGTHSLTYRVLIENTGLIVLNDVQISDDLDTVFAGASSYVLDGLVSSALTVNPNYATAGDFELLTGVDSLAAGASATADLSVTVTPGSVLGPYSNTAVFNAVTPGGAVLTDDSDDGAVVDGNGNGDPTDDGDPTVVSFVEDPQLGIAKQLSVGPINNGDGSYSLTYHLLIENTGLIVLNNVQIVDDLNTAFAGATSFELDELVSQTLTVNPNYAVAGDFNLLSGTDTLLSGQSATADLTLKVVPGSLLGPYSNVAVLEALTPGGEPLSDVSDDAPVVDQSGNGDPTDDSDPTLVTFAESPQLGVAKQVLTEPVNNGDGSYSLSYRIRVENSGDVAVFNAQITDNLATSFQGATRVVVDSVASTDLALNPSYDGAGTDGLLAGSGTLVVGQLSEIDLAITVVPGANFGPYDNSAIASGTSPAGTPLTDDSVDGVDPDANGNADPGDDASPASVSFAETAVIGLAKSASTPSTPNFDGTFTTTFALNLVNLGDVVLNNVNVVDDLVAQLAPATVVRVENLVVTGGLATVNSSYDGVADTSLLPANESLSVGGSALITVDVVFNPNDNLGPFANQAVALAESPGNPNPGTPNITDDSTDGAVADAAGDGDPSNDSVPTPVTFVTGSNCALVMPEELLPGSSFSIVMTDNDSFYDPAVVETVPVTVRNTVSGETEVVSLTETGADSGEFVGSILTQYDVNAGANDDGTLFAQHADLIDTTYQDLLTATGGVGTCSDSGVLLGLATLEGFAWLDFDTDDNFGAGEEALVGWIIRVEGPGGIVEVPVNADGSYSVPDLIPGAGYTVSLVHPDSNAVFGQLTELELPPQTTVLEQNLAIDPTGVFYDSVERTPVEGVGATLVNSSGTALPAICLLDGQQGQITGEDGRYRFDVLADADPACASGETYTLIINQPAEYNPGFSALLPPQASPIDPTGLGSPVRVGDDVFAPQLTDSTTYHVAFTLSTDDPSVVWNHIPLDPLGVGGFSVRLTKDVNQPTTSVGGLVSYTITVENLSPVTIPGIAIVDSLPPGFSLVQESPALDGSTEDIITTGERPVTFAGITLLSGQRRELTYVLRTGAGVTHGEYTNSATPFVGPAQIGNSDTAQVLVVADPDFEETTVIGKVWNDRDADGWQDSAKATRVKVVVELERPVNAKAALLQRADRTSEQLNRTLHEGVVVRELPGRYGWADFSNDNEVIIRGHYQEKVEIKRITVSSKEGSRLVVTQGGDSREDRGAVAGGRNSQHLELHYRQYPVPGGGYELLIELRNQGLEEPGIPGVRLATVEGLMIETDASGRYHIAGVDGGFMERGRNFIVKLDPATVPKGTQMVSENPRVKRLSQGLMNEFDFAVQLPEYEPPAQTMSLKIAEVFFEPGSAEVLPEYSAQLSQLVTALNRGTQVTLTLKAYPTPGDSSANARRLAQRRADALLKTLQSLSRRDLGSKIEIRIDDGALTNKESEEPATDQEQGMTGKLKNALGWVFSLMVPMAHADTADCMSNICNSAGVPIFIVDVAEESVLADSRKLKDQGRVEMHGDYVTRLPDGGVIWMTEDPARPEPRLSIVGPSHIPTEDGKFTADSEFVIHTNYASYFDLLRVDVFLPADVDRREPVAQLEVDTSRDKKLFYTLAWPLIGTSIPEGGELVYRVSAIDSEGRVDRTLEQKTFVIEQQMLETQTEQQPGFAVNAYTLQVVSVDDGVVVFVPGHEFEERLEIRPLFPTLGAELGSPDKLKLDTIVERWVGARNVTIEVVGHTSSVPISMSKRHLFADNYALSRARAKVVADYLARGLGKRVSRSTAVGRGADTPLGTNSTQEGRSLNRRAEISLLGTQVESEPAVHVVDRETGVSTHFADYRRAAKLDAVQESVLPSTVAETTDRLLKRNDLQQRRIPVYGSRVRVQGNDVGADHQVWINGEGIRVDRQARFAVEYILPTGQHVTDLAVANGEAVTVQREIPLEVTGRYAFMVALADFTLSDSNISGSVEALSGDDRYAEDMLVEGRLAFYLKGKMKGKYLITAQLDTQEEQVKNLFDNIHQKDPQNLFRRLDPDRYYPVYGDDSTVVSDVNTHGRMYVRLDWDNSEAVWGNFETGLTGNELTQYSRGLYGARLTHESMEATAFDESKRHITAFVSENQTALGHSEFLGTGGSLYYLRHTDILPGSEKLRIEVRDPDTNRVLENKALTRGLDYEVDELQGRVILSRPLLPLVQGGAPSLILDGALDGSVAILVADYEYLPDDFDANQVVYGARAKQWFGDHVAIGGTYVEEGRADEDYNLAGVDLTLQAGQDSWLKLEWGSSDATQANRFISTNGGLSFNNAAVLDGASRSGDAYNVDFHLNGADLGLTALWTTNAWYKEVDDQFSVARRDDGANVREYGVETQMPLREWRLGMRASHFEVDEQLERREIAAQVGGDIGDRGNLATEIKYIDEVRTSLNGSVDTQALLLGLQYEHRLAKWISLYAGGQTVLDDNGGYQSNEQFSGGVKVALGKRSNGTVEYRNGDRGNGALVGLEHRLTDRFAVYGTMTHSTDTTSDPFSGSDTSSGMLENAGTNFAVGQRWSLNDRTRLFTERQFSRNDDFSGVGTVFGLDYASKSGWHYGFTAQEGDITSETGIVERQTLTVGVGYQGRKTRYSTKLEYRDDSGAENVEQWLTSNRFEWKLSDTYRMAAKLNYSESDNALDDTSDAKLIEGSVGLARRPVDTNRFNWLAKYTYLHDLQSFGQRNAQTDQRSHIGAVEGIYKLNRQFALGAKVARRVGELRLARNTGPWFKSTANFGAARLRWHALRKWDAMAEYRWLQIEEANSERGGWLVSIDRHVADNFKIGVGYNFTDFSDDLTNLDYDHKGWFLNLLGKY